MSEYLDLGEAMSVSVLAQSFKVSLHHLEQEFRSLLSLRDQEIRRISQRVADLEAIAERQTEMAGRRQAVPVTAWQDHPSSGAPKNGS